MDEARRVRVALVVDLDNTLVKTNTLFELMSIICPFRYLILSRILKPIAIINKVFSRDVYKLMLTNTCLHGLSKNLLVHIGRLYYEKMIKERDRYNRKILELVKGFRNGPRILLTASSDFIAENFKLDGFDVVYSSESIYKNGVFRGMNDLYLRKHRVIEALARIFDEVIVIDDEPEKELYIIPNVRVIRAR